MFQISVNQNEFGFGLEVIKKCISKDRSRPQLNLCLVTVDYKKVTFHSIDGYRASTYSFVHHQDNIEPFSFLIDYFKIPKCKQEYKNIVITKDDETTSITFYDNGNKVTRVVKYSGEFVDCEKIYNNVKENFSICFNARLMIDCLEPFTKLNNRFNLVELVLESPTRPLMLRAKQNDNEIKSILLPLKLN